MTQRKEELSTTLPSVKPNNCWWSDEVLQPAEPNTTQSYRDFVLISEFSELEGPLPLAVVANSSYIDLKHYTEKQCPNNPHLKELSKIGLDSFDFNAFVLRVVSVDRSTEYEQIDQDLIEPLTPSSVLADSPPNTFSIPDDTQVYFTDSEHKFFAFTHHLTLFDINARGYVHPVALSYITRDPDKIVIRFEELMEQFNQVSVKMKKGNYSNFTLDLKCRLIDLEFTESAVSQQQKPTLSLQAIKQAITATKLMIDTLESSITQMNNTSLKGSKPILSSYTTVPKDYQPKCIDTLYPVPHFERKLRSLAQLCQEPDEEESQSSLAQKTATMIPLLSIIESQQQQQQTEERSTFSNAITHDMYSEAIKSIQDMTCYLGKSSMVLDVDDEEELFINPISSALTFGRTFMLNMDNPQPREEEKEETSVTLKDESAMPTLPNETSLETEKEEIRNLSSSQDTDDDEFYFPVLQAPLQLWKPDPAPTHLLQVLRKYQSLIVDVIFSLLTGRTVLIQGSVSNKHNVQQVVHALAVFVPGQSRDRHQIIDWFETSRFTDSHIGSIKLVGIAKENMDASIHIEGSCVLDIDAKNGSLNSSPVYVEGQWINQLLDRMMLFSSDESYLAYLHTVFMTMSLKAFVYHHLYVCDEFKLDETASDTAVVSKGYTSEASESSTLSRKWSIRLLNYLKKQEDPETDLSSRSSSAATASVHDSTTTDDEDYSEENQATVTLQNLLQKNNQQDKPRTIVGLFSATGMDEPVITNATASTTTHTIDQDLRRNSISTTYTRESSISSGSSPNLSDDEGYDLRRPPTTDRSFLNFGAEDLEYFGQAHESDEDDSSSEEEKPKSRPARRHGSKHRLRKLSDVGPDGVSYTERRGRRYLQEKMKVYGDDQTIIVYLATCVL